MKTPLVVAGLFLATSILAAGSDFSSDFRVEAAISRDGPRLTVQVVSLAAKSNWRYDLHVTTTNGLDQHIEFRNGQALTPRDVRLADVNGDGSLEILVVGGKTTGARTGSRPGCTMPR